jgi:hypothetical protein
MHPELVQSRPSAVAKNYPDVTAEQLKAPVREAGKGGKSDSETARALRGKYQGADFEDLLADVREAALKSAEHDQLLKAIRQHYAQISQTKAKVIAKTETNRALLDEPVPGRLPVSSSERLERPVVRRRPERVLRCASRSMISMKVLRNGL